MDANVPDDDGATAPPPAWMTLEEIKPARAKPIDREGILQKHIKLFVRDAVTVKHQFFSFDRGKGASKFSHMRQKAKGAVKGCPDTLLRVIDIPAIWSELKWGHNNPDEDQENIGRILIAIGDVWECCKSVVSYYELLHRSGVPMRNHAYDIAAGHDRSVLALIAKEEAKRGTPAKAPKVSRGRKAEPRFLMGKRATARARAGRML